jgi:transposase
MKSIGIDVAKNSFVVAYPSQSGFSILEFSNNSKGIKKFIDTLDPNETHCILEATGTYSSLIVYMLCSGSIPVSLVNPKQIKHFAKMMLSVTKTDKLDAKLISMYGEKMNPPLFVMPSATIQILRQQRTLMRQLKKQFHMLSNIEESLKVLPIRDSKSYKIIFKTKSFLEKQISDLEGEMNDLATKEFKSQLELLTSIKGIGPAIATTLIMSTGGFTLFSSAKKFAKFIGVCPSYQQSGTSLKTRGVINRNGDADIRSMLYVASWSAIRFNSDCKQMYERLKAAGKPSKVALIAVINKLLRQAFAVVLKQEKYCDNYPSIYPKNILKLT